MDDKQIVELYWQRNEQAIAETAAKYETYCMKISQNILSDRADSEENVNDTYLHAWKAIPPQRPAILSAFLGRIARNLALNRYKAKSAQKRQGDAFALSLDELDDCAVSLPDPESETAAAELGASISAFLRTQSEEVRSMFVLRYFYCESIEELSARFRCGESRIKTTLLRTRRKLREHLIKEGYFYSRSTCQNCFYHRFAIVYTTRNGIINLWYLC